MQSFAMFKLLKACGLRFISVWPLLMSDALPSGERTLIQRCSSICNIQTTLYQYPLPAVLLILYHPGHSANSLVGELRPSPGLLSLELRCT